MRAPDWDGMMSVVGGPRNGKFDSGRKGEEAARGGDGGIIKGVS